MTSTYIETYLASLRTSLDLVSRKEILIAWDLLNQTYERGGTVWICGNGGSASLADHLAVDFVTQCGIKSQSLTSLAMITATGNDFGYEMAFSKSLEILGDPKDLLMVLSGSGNSSNILEILRQARRMKIETLAVLGKDGGKIHFGELSDHEILVPSPNMGQSQDGHQILGHILVYGLKESWGHA